MATSERFQVTATRRALGALALLATLACAAPESAHAFPGIYIPGPRFYVPRPVYVAPPVYVPPPVYYVPRPRVYHPVPYAVRRPRVRK